MFGLSPLMLKVAIALGAATLIGLAYFAWYEHVRHEAQAQIIAQEKAATAAEHERRVAALQDAYQQATGAASRLASTEKQNATLQQEIARLSARNDSHACLDRDGVRRLGQAGHKAN